MKKLVLLFAFFVSTMSMFANEGTTTQYSSDALIEFELPIVISAPEEFFFI
ncbi:MAG: hypothetical protein LUF85_11970 [Bacteroides sp.]|nr:hypothetical protein [Bacteroides sp.]